MKKIIHVHLMGKRKDYYFGSIEAVFSVLTEEQIGITKSYLRHVGLSGGGVVTTKKALIKQSVLITSGNRGGSKNKEHILTIE